MTAKEKLQMKTYKIEEIKDALKKTQMLTQGRGGKDDPTYVIEEVVKEYENLEDEGEEEFYNDQDEEDDLQGFQDDEEDEDDNDDNNENGLEEVDPQVLKCQERIKYLRHKCVGSLGNNLYEKAFAAFKST